MPITWFFLPRPPWKDGAPDKVTTGDAGRFGIDLALLVDLVFGDDSHQGQLLEQRLAEFLDELGPASHRARNASAPPWRCEPRPSSAIASGTSSSGKGGSEWWPTK